jgi:hypothetical protein
MNKPALLAFLIGGVILIIYGVSASNSVGSGFSRMFTGSPTDKTIWLLVVGAAAVIIGLGALLRGTKTI